MEKRYPVTMLCAACVPWNKDLSFNETVFRREVSHFIEKGAKSIYIFGTAGEGYAVSREMFAEIVEAFINECGKGSGVMPMTGIIGTSMTEMKARIRLAYDIGCRDFQIAFPCWGPLSDDEAVVFFSSVCGDFPDCRFIHYNNLLRTKRSCSIELYTRIAEAVPNFVAAKFSTANIYEIYGIVNAECPVTFFFVDAGYTFASMYGKCGLLNSFASVDMDLAWKYFHAGQDGDLETLIDLGAYQIELVNCFRWIGRELIDSAYDKSIERIADPGFDNSLYPPYTGLTEQEFVRSRDMMEAVIKKYRDKYIK